MLRSDCGTTARQGCRQCTVRASKRQWRLQRPNGGTAPTCILRGWIWQNHLRLAGGAVGLWCITAIFDAHWFRNECRLDAQCVHTSVAMKVRCEIAVTCGFGGGPSAARSALSPASLKIVRIGQQTNHHQTVESRRSGREIRDHKGERPQGRDHNGRAWQGTVRWEGWARRGRTTRGRARSRRVRGVDVGPQQRDQPAVAIS